MNFLTILLDYEATRIVIYECADVGGSSVGALDCVDTDLNVPTTRQ